MPFFLKSCLKLRKKKSKKKSKSEKKIMTGITDVTGPLTTDEIWVECEIDSSASNVSDIRDHTLSDINKTKCLVRPSSSEIDETSADESTTNQSNEVCSQITSIEVSEEHIGLKSDEQLGNDCLEEKSNRQMDIAIERKQSLGTLQTVSKEQVGDTGKTEKNFFEDGAENSDASLNEETFSEPSDLRLSDLNKIDVNTNVMKKIEEINKYTQNSFKQGDQSSLENIVGTNNKNTSEKFPCTDNKSAESLIKYQNYHEIKPNEISSNIKTKRSNFTCSTFIHKTDHDTECTTHTSETFSEYANYERSDNITSSKQTRTDIRKDSCNENLENNSTELSEVVPETQEIDTQKVDNECSNVEQSLDINYPIIDENQQSGRSAHETPFLNSIKSSSDDDNVSTREEAYNYLKADHIRNANYERSEKIASSKQNRTFIHIDNCNENSSSNLGNNSTERTEGVPEIQEIDTQKVYNECLNVEEYLDINHSIIDESPHSDRSAHGTPFLNSIKSSSDNENASKREEVYNYFKTDHLRNEFLSKAFGLNERKTLYFHSNSTVEPSTSLSTDKIPVTSEHDSLSKESQLEMSISRKIKENDINYKDCNNDEMKLFGHESGTIFNSNNNLEYGNGIPFSDSHQYNLDIRGGHTKGFKVRESELNVSQERVDLQNKFKDSEVKREEDKSKKPLMNEGERFNPDSSKYSHLTLQENEISTQISVHNLPLNFEDVNSLNHNENIFSEEYVLSDSEEGHNFRAGKNDCSRLKNDAYEETSLHLKKDLKGNKSIHNCNENFTDKTGDINSSPNKSENTVCKSYENNDISYDIRSRFNNEINQASYGNKPHEEMQAKHKDFSEEVDNLDHSPQNVDNNYFIAGNTTKVYKKSTEENISFKLAEDLDIHSDVNTSSCNKRNIQASNDIVAAKDDFQLQRTTNPSKNADFLYTEDDYDIRKSPRLYKEDTNHHYDISLHTSENVEKVCDYEKQELYDDETCECQVDQTFDLKSTKSEEVKKDTALESCESSTINEIYENYYAFQNTQSSKRLNGFSNISSTSESSISSRCSDKSCSKPTDVKKKESRIFSISACGDTRNNENIDGTIDNFKMLDKEYDMVRLKEAKLAVSRNENQGIKREPKLTINITRKNKNDALKMTQNLTINQSGDNLKKGFKSINSNEIDRLTESIEIFNKKKEQALSDMKPNIRVIPVKKAEVFKIRTKTEKICTPQKARSPFLKFSLHSNLNEVERNLKELMPESLFEINKLVDRHPALHQNNNVGELFRKKPTEISPTSDSETESSQTSENMSPVRKRILNASRDIRSPKYPFRTHQRMPLGNSHYIKRPVIIKSPKVNLVAYLTKDEKNRYTIKKGYRMYNQECGNVRIFSPEYRHSEYKTNNIENAVNNKSTSPDYLKSKFDDMFKRYARKGRSNGELISYKRSTVWLRDAGIIGKSLTAEEANNAFKCTAGMKVTLNKGDYRHYLMKLARLKRLNYNEVYKRLCSLNNRIIE